MQLTITIDLDQLPVASGYEAFQTIAQSDIPHVSRGETADGEFIRGREVVGQWNITESVSGEVVTHYRGEALPSLVDSTNILMYGEVWQCRAKDNWVRVLTGASDDTDSVDVMDDEEMTDQVFTYNMP